MTIQKYQKVTRDEFLRWRGEHEDYRRKVSGDPRRLRCHLMPETGWLNDPNGLCQKDGVYHIYYQYTPFEPTGQIKLWNHCTTRDFIHYEDRGPVLFPDQDFDAHGVYSGSAFLKDGTIHYFYTGNVKYFDRPDYDYIRSGRGSNTVHVSSPDGEHFSEKELLMTTADYPADISCHVRDPKILEYEGSFYMVLGARDRSDRGLALLYRSSDLEKWECAGRITSPRPLGYMWECPDLFLLDGRLRLICCPQGVPRQEIDFANIYQCLSMEVLPDFEGGSWKVNLDSGFSQVDRGFDFYAPQSFLDEKGRRILIGWMGIPDAEYTNPTEADGWQHALTIPRVLSLKKGRLIQEPVPELMQLRDEIQEFPSSEQFNKAGIRELVYELNVEFENCSSTCLTLRDGAFLRYENGLLTLHLEKGGFGRDRRSVRLERLKKLRIFSDTTSLEIFVNGGEEVFTTRVYGEAGPLKIEGAGVRHIGFCRLNPISVISCLS